MSSIRLAEWRRGSVVRRGRLLSGWSVGLLAVSLYGLLWAMLPGLLVVWNMMVIFPLMHVSWHWKRFYWGRSLDASAIGTMTLGQVEILQEVDRKSVKSGTDYGILLVEGSTLMFRGETCEFRLHRGHIEPSQRGWDDSEATMLLTDTPTLVTVRFRNPSDQAYFRSHVLEWLKAEPVGQPESVYPPLMPQVSSRNEIRMRMAVGALGSIVLTAVCAGMGIALLSILLVPGFWALIFLDDSPRRIELVERAWEASEADALPVNDRAPELV